MQTKVFHYTLTAFCAAIIAVLAQITIPLPLVPITGQTLAIGLVVTILGLKFGTYAVILYVCLGAFGLPVFQLFTGGFGILVGPTGGYILGFIPTALVIGLYLKWFGTTFKHAVIANLIGMFITLLFGAAWLKIAANLTWGAAFLSGIAPFIIVGIIKGVIAAWLDVIVRERLIHARMLEKLT
ncbi:biotin transporter BioY [Solibacillus sp. FSL H8-0538]|uniref:biotin transporter BioY n=1 Tax=Solibacillus sp. FSL H8-0538 TaxID=2921400 RepID=UPI0030F609BF